MKKLVLLAALVCLTSCAPQRPWIKTEKVYTNQSQGFTVEMPENWMRSSQNDYLLATRDGFPLQSIYIRRFDIKQNPLKNTKKILRKDMLPQEVAEIVLDDTISASSLSDVKTEENVPVTISGVSGFRMVYTFRNISGLRMKAVLCGRLKDDWLLIVRYSAPARHYFDMDAPTFENVLRTLKVTDEAKK
ncbi:MAG TPA: hypothetical protein VMT62_14005 [Syntrophorhabdaceae bacterium]|nr:hypothetical protein [Syntrophorhabdaceae bacterium]